MSDPDTGREAPPLFVHGTAVRLSGKGVLLIGPPASGKSDLALRLIDAGAVLIADDQVGLDRDGDHLHARPHARLAGLIELRGIGIMRLPFEDGALDLVVDLTPSAASPEQLPDPATASWLGIDLPTITLKAEAPSAVARIRTVLDAERVF